MVPMPQLGIDPVRNRRQNLIHGARGGAPRAGERFRTAACNLALLMRSIYGAGKPRAAHEQAIEAVFAILAFIEAITSILEP
jgi:hypothetical protein